MKQYAAGIVLFNPELGRLKDSIDAINKQVKTVYCFNNGSKNTNQIKLLVSIYPNCVLLDCKDNLGIGTAINRIVKRAESDNIEWLLTLDQDSICDDYMISEFEKYTNINYVGIICPLFIDKRRPSESLPEDSFSYLDFCITSGSFMNIKIFEKVGRMDEYLFVGSVDDEYCYRLVQRGYKIIQVNNVVMDHELGNLTPSKYARLYLKLGVILHCNKIKALSYKREVSALRTYYATRNIVYLSKKYKKHPYKFSKRYAIINGISCILRSSNKLEISKAVIKGIQDGYII